MADKSKYLECIHYSVRRFLKLLKWFLGLILLILEILEKFRDFLS